MLIPTYYSTILTITGRVLRQERQESWFQFYFKVTAQTSPIPKSSLFGLDFRTSKVPAGDVGLLTSLPPAIGVGQQSSRGRDKGVKVLLQRIRYNQLQIVLDSWINFEDGKEEFKRNQIVWLTLW